MKLHWLTPGTLMNLLMRSLPVHAAKLKSWRCDANHDQLEINTEGNVQLQARLIFNSTRLVMDSSRTLLVLPQSTQPLGGTIRAIRVRQLDQPTDRIVVEMAVNTAQLDQTEVFVSVHAHTVTEDCPDVNGVEVYYYHSGLDSSRAVRNKILQSVNFKDPRIRGARFYVLREASMPSILVETGYMTGKEDMPKQKTAQYQNQMGEAIANGIPQYLKRE